jgi:hypothetical protein
MTEYEVSKRRSHDHLLWVLLCWVFFWMGVIATSLYDYYYREPFPVAVAQVQSERDRWQDCTYLNGMTRDGKYLVVCTSNKKQKIKGDQRK